MVPNRGVGSKRLQVRAYLMMLFISVSLSGLMRLSCCWALLDVTICDFDFFAGVASMKLLKSSVSGDLRGGLLQLLVRSSRMAMVSSTRFSSCISCGVCVEVLSAFALVLELMGEGCLDLLCAPWLV